MHSSHDHNRKTHLARDGKSLCGVEKANGHLFFNIGEDYHDIQSQFFIDGPEQHGCLRCRRAWHREQAKE
jgi:hypothetical protein